jgi:hypothetical protein
MASPNVVASTDVTNLVATTLLNYHKEFADNVSNSNAITAQLKQGNRIRVVDGGRRIATPLTYAEETFAWYSGTELLSRAVKETISDAEYDPANAVASVTLSGPDLAKNRGKERILNLLEGKIDNAEATMSNNITKSIYGDGSVAKSFVGLKAMVTDNGTGTVGGINTTPWTFWMNQFQPVVRATGLQYPALKAAMNALWIKLVRGTEKPDLIVADAEVYATYESGLQENSRYSDSKLGSLGFETLKYKSASIVFDGAATGISVAPAGAAYFLNTKYFKLEIYSGYNFEALDLPDQSPDMDAVTKHIGFMGCLTLSNRAMQGKLVVSGT